MSRLSTIQSSSIAFGLDLYRNISEGTSDNNVCISPWSTYESLCITREGARLNTEKQIRDALYLQNVSSQDIHDAVASLKENANESRSVHIANSLFLKTGLSPREDFRNILIEKYKAKIKSEDFAGDPAGAARSINKWASEATRGKIKEIVSGVDPFTIMYLINAVYFKSNWKSPFDSYYTRPEKFHLNSSSSIYVSMMDHSGDFRYTKHNDSKCQALELPYEDKETTMLLLLPQDIEGLARIENMMSPKYIEDIRSKLQVEEDLLVRIPSFKIEASYSLNASLRKMGMTDMFESALANLEGVCKNASLRVSSVVQKTYIEVNEEGTEAAAVTSCASDGISSHVPVCFYAYHPFMFLIFSKNYLLFIGKLMRPEEVPIQDRD